uniref:Uncharacterized protein n=1 Tax=Elaeophora elaphi TaxID=1147741 RepID=A0A158Q7K5_9BILA
RPPKFRSIYARDSLDFIEQSSVPEEKFVIPAQYLDNMEQLLAFANDSVNENSTLGYLESHDLNTGIAC